MAPKGAIFNEVFSVKNLHLLWKAKTNLIIEKIFLTENFNMTPQNCLLPFAFKYQNNSTQLDKHVLEKCFIYNKK